MTRSLLREAAFAYVRTFERYEQAQARGDSERADEAYSRIQDMEQSLNVTETNSAWRAGRWSK
jgi:hypothetical protein